MKLPRATHLICHCRSEEQARNLNASLEQRFAECGLTLHPEKTKIVYCKDDDRRGTYRDHKFIFSAARSGRYCRADGMVLASCSAQRRATKLSKRFGRQFAAGRYMSAATSRLMIWRGCSTRTSAAGSTIIADNKSALYPTLRHIDRILARWAHRKFKSLRRHRRRSQQWLERIARRQPDLFAHWRLLQGRGRTMGAG